MPITRVTILSLMIALSSLTVTAEAAATLEISGTPASRAVAGDFYMFTPTVLAPADCVRSFAVTGKPAWAQLNSATGTLSGIPTAVGSTLHIILGMSCGESTATLPAFNIIVESTQAKYPSQRNAYLSWTRPDQNTDGSPLTNLAGYRLRYGSSPAAMNSHLFIGSPDTTEAEISGLAPGSWSFEIRAITAEYAESAFSAVKTTIIP
jgi:hypothetical protein